MTAVVDRAALERHTINLPDGVVERALHEVLARGSSERGFAAGRIEGARGLPAASRELDRILRAELIRPLGTRRRLRFGLAFMKAGDGDAPPEHMFSPASMAWAPRIFRVIFNLSEYPRRVLLWDRDDDTAPEELLVPGRRCGAVHALHYVAGEVPHCAVNDALGYFLASYEAPLPA
jgi:hypothetical protein